MPGPCSLPNGNKSQWDELNEIVCNNHYVCDMAAVDKKGNIVKHEYLTYRMWLAKRGRLTTGKSV